ncbi:Hydroxyethylthiazole kinase OS=Lysinibacillus sphaericus OX=1421 GN=thiM PE=3 SV=1 [Lysinibacillus sphaericus]
MVSIASALLVNIGTHGHEQRVDVTCRKKSECPWYTSNFGPVAAGATAYRKQTVLQLLDSIHFAVIRCNVGELAAIANVQWQQKVLIVVLVPYLLRIKQKK